MPFSFIFSIKIESEALRQYEAKKLKKKNQQILCAAAATIFQYFQLTNDLTWLQYLYGWIVDL